MKALPWRGDLDCPHDRRQILSSRRGRFKGLRTGASEMTGTPGLWIKSPFEEYALPISSVVAMLQGITPFYGRKCWPTMAISGFVEQGGLTRENGQKFREAILFRNNSIDLAELYCQWSGRAPKMEPMRKHRGLSA